MEALEIFGRPIYLVLLLLLPLVYLLQRGSLSGLAVLRRRLAVALRLLVVLLLVLALAELRLVQRSDRLAVIYAVDVSASIPPEHRQAALEFARRSAAARDGRRGDQVGLLVFGKNAGIEALPRAEELKVEALSTLIEKDFTDLQSAIRLSAAVFPEGAAKRLVLITDGNENRGRAIEEARAAREHGVSIDVLPVAYEYPGEILVDKVVVDPEVHQGEPFDVRIVVEATRSSRAMLRLFESQRQVHSQEVDLRAGKNVFTVPRRLDVEGLHAYEAMVEPLTAADDAVIQNNSAASFTFIRGQPKILLCSDDPRLDSALLSALAEERIKVVAVSPDGLPGEIEEYLAYDAILLSNVPADQLSDDRMKLFQSLVKAVGLGFAMIGGENSFGAGGYLGTPVEELLPVSMDIQQKKILPNGALGIVMHSCEINNGNYWAKQTVQQAIKVLSPRDYAGVLYYDGMGGEAWLFPMTQVSQKQMMLSKLASFTPGDMPDFSRIVTMAHQSLVKTPASIRHIIILSDGDPNMPSDGQVQAVRADRITISTICMGWHSSPANMKRLAAIGGGNYYELSDPQKLPSIFIREATTVRKSLISERDFQPVVRSWGSFLRGIDPAGMPPLKGYVITTRKELAEEELSAPPVEGDPTLDPILASWAYGLGKSVAFTSDAGRRWGANWTSWKDHRKFWSQLVRWVSREGSGQGLRASRTVEGEVASITLDALDEAGNFLNGLTLEGAVVAPDFQTQPVEIRQVAPGRYRAEFPAGKKGTYLATLRYERDGQPYTYSTGLSVPYSPEYRHLSTNYDLLSRLADATLGKMVDPQEPGSVFRRDFPPARSSQDLWPHLLMAAAALFFLDIFVRRVAIDYRKAFAGALEKVRARRRAAPARAGSDERLAVLLKKKSEVRASQETGRRFYEPSPDAGEARLDEGFDAGARPAHRLSPLVPSEGTRPAADRGGRSAVAAPAGEAATAAQTAKKEPAEESYTSRLLAAKKRALEKRDGNP